MEGTFCGSLLLLICGPELKRKQGTRIGATTSEVSSSLFFPNRRKRVKERDLQKGEKWSCFFLLLHSLGGEGGKGGGEKEERQLKRALAAVAVAVAVWATGMQWQQHLVTLGQVSLEKGTWTRRFQRARVPLRRCTRRPGRRMHRRRGGGRPPCSPSSVGGSQGGG